MSVKTADIIILIGMIALAACVIFGIGTADATAVDSETGIVTEPEQTLIADIQ